ncbi:CocE/NonD family hydrolase [Marinicella sp. W31]|uniref:CocE/NonD family hydrolase n=1 Tax=Marinicella sp. W31 TaxID=3023713 RepID=UPI00375811C5
MKFQIYLLFIVFIVLNPLFSPGFAQNKTNSESIKVTLNTKIPLSENALIGVTVWQPDDPSRTFPTVLVSTPYISNESHGRGKLYAQNGYAMVSIDLEGRGASDGTFTPFSDHGPVICKAIKWVKNQKWSDGNVMLRGGSYRGMTQWMAARSCPEEILTMIPTASVYPGHDFPVVDGHRMQKYTAGWLGFVSGAGANLNFFIDSDYWKDREIKSFTQHIPMSEYDAFVGAPNEHFQQWVRSLSTPQDWHLNRWTDQDYAEMNMPILTVTGLYDGDQPGSLRFFKEHHQANDDSAHFLVIGPWDHGGTRQPRSKLSEQVSFGPDAVINMDELNINWFNWILGKAPRPDFLQDKVAFYIGGEDKWHYAESLDAISDKTRRFFLSAQNDEAYDVFNSGKLVETPDDSDVTHAFLSDPLDTRFLQITDSNWNKIRDGHFLTQYPAFLPETLVFHSPVFSEKVILAGQITSTLYLEVDTPDVDIFVTVYAIFPDGKTLYLGGDVVRARFRNGLIPQMLEQGKVEKFKFDNFLWNSWALPKGSRLRFTVGPYNDPSAQKNYNSGGKLGFETKQDAMRAKVILHHNREFPSHLELPLMRR